MAKKVYSLFGKSMRDIRLGLLVALVCLPVLAVKAAQAQPNGPVYGNVRYDDDYSFLKAGTVRNNDPFNRLKRIPLWQNGTMTFGGHYRFRFENDQNRRFGAGDPAGQSFFLNRLFLFADIQMANRIRLFVEMKSAGISGNDLPPAPIMRDDPDFQNLFAEIGVLHSEKTRLALRAGRQEMQFGKQRLISPLDWANTRRTFEGARVLLTMPRWKIDAFSVRVVEVNPEKINRADRSQNFFGLNVKRLYASTTLSGYVLKLDENDRLAVSGSGVAGNYKRYTAGLAYDGSTAGFDWTTEAAYQFGSFSSDDISTYMLALEGGYVFSNLPTKPHLNAGFDFASGDSKPGDDKMQTFNQLFPLGHAYFGWADQIGRQNVLAMRVGLNVQPVRRLGLKVVAHTFRLANEKDALYNPGGAATRHDPTGLAGKNIASEIDFEAVLKLGVHASVMVGYVYFAPGDFIEQTGPARSPSLFYVMVPVKF